jgi:integrase
MQVKKLIRRWGRKSRYASPCRGGGKIPFKIPIHAWRGALKRCGLNDKLFHDLRRTAATDLIEAGVSQKVAMAVTGHKTSSIFQRYQIVKTDDIRQGMALMADYRGRK